MSISPAYLHSGGEAIQSEDDETLDVEQLRARYPKHSTATSQALSQLDHSAIDYELVAQTVVLLLGTTEAKLAQYAARMRPSAPDPADSAAGEEFRIDEADGMAYNRGEFADFYGPQERYWLCSTYYTTT